MKKHIILLKRLEADHSVCRGELSIEGTSFKCCTMERAHPSRATCCTIWGQHALLLKDGTAQLWPTYWGGNPLFPKKKGGLHLGPLFAPAGTYEELRTDQIMLGTKFETPYELKKDSRPFENFIDWVAERFRHKEELFLQLDEKDMQFQDTKYEEWLEETGTGEDEDDFLKNWTEDDW